MLNLATYNNSPDHSTKGTTSHLNVLCVLVNIRFQVLFHSPSGVLFTFPSQYFSTIGHQVVFRLGGWAPRIPNRFHVSVGTLDTGHFSSISSTRLSLSLVYAFQHTSTISKNAYSSPNPKRIATLGLASFAFARHYLRNLG